MNEVSGPLLLIPVSKTALRRLYMDRMSQHGQAVAGFLQYLPRAALTEHGDDAHLLEGFVRHGDEAAFERLLLQGPMVLGLWRHEQELRKPSRLPFHTLARKASTITNKRASNLPSSPTPLACRR